MSEVASKKPRIESKLDPELQKLAERACQQRELIRQKIKELDPNIDPSSEDIPPSKPPGIVSQLSNPAFEFRLPFPFVGSAVPKRFEDANSTNNDSWLYMGREKFADLIDEFRRIRCDPHWTALYVYGTKGYGKSHLLAAFVCVLAVGMVEVVYIPESREFRRNPVKYMKTAMLFAWADDKSVQQEIVALETQKGIYEFLDRRENAVLVFDQLNALQKKEGDDESEVRAKGELRQWLERLCAGHKSILSSSTNNRTFLEEQLKDSSIEIMYAYGGLTEVSLRSDNSFVKGMLLTMI